MYIAPQPIYLPITIEKFNAKGMSKKKKTKLRQQKSIDQQMEAKELLPIQEGCHYQYFFDTSYKDKNHICWQETKIIVDQEFTFPGMNPKDILTLHYFSYSKELILAHSHEYFYLNPNILKVWRENTLVERILVIMILILIIITVQFILFLFIDVWLGIIICFTISMIIMMCTVICYIFHFYIFMKSKTYILLKNVLGFNMFDIIRFLLFPEHFQISSNLPFVNEENQHNWFLIKPKRSGN